VSMTVAVRAGSRQMGPCAAAGRRGVACALHACRSVAYSLCPPRSLLPAGMHTPSASQSGGGIGYHVISNDKRGAMQRLDNIAVAAVMQRGGCLCGGARFSRPASSAAPQDVQAWRSPPRTPFFVQCEEQQHDKTD
jgi:hypothetical protein